MSDIMPAPITIEKAFSQEPYRSIISLLVHFKENGLKLKEIQYALIEKHGLSYTLQLEEKFSNSKEEKILNNLVQAGKIKRYQPRLTKSKTKTKRVVTIRNILKRQLDRMKHLGLIHIENGYYKLNFEIYEAWEQYENIKKIKQYNTKQIQIYHLKPTVKRGDAPKHHPIIALYGFHNEIIDDKTFNKIKKEASNIIDSLFELSCLHSKKIKDYWFNELKRFREYTKSNTIKKIMRAEMNTWSKKLYPGYLYYLLINLFKNNSLTEKKFHDLLWRLFKNQKETLEIEFNDDLNELISYFNEYKLNNEEINEISSFGWKLKKFFQEIDNVDNIAISVYFGTTFDMND